jgi:diguanylate cyclase (GGDEF)-like protein/PAS domain S-box-containing protein
VLPPECSRHAWICTISSRALIFYNVACPVLQYSPNDCRNQFRRRWLTVDASKPQQPAHVLVITDNPADAGAIRVSLEGAPVGSFEVEWVGRLSDGINRLQKRQSAAVILDLSLPDSHGIDGFDRVSMVAPRVPILILSGPEDEAAAKQAVQRGAQDYLPRNRLDSYALPRAVQTVIALKIASEALLGDRERAEVTLNSIGDAVLSTDFEGKIQYLNAVAERMTGWGREEAYGRPLNDVFRVINKGTGETARDPLRFALQQDRTVGLTTNSVLVRRDGVESAIEDSAAPIHDREGVAVGAVIVFRDVGEAQALARKMAYVAQHDILTELPNRLLLNDRLIQAMGMAERHHNKVAVLFVDLDDFKTVNDSMGHATGDAVLQSVAKRLVHALRHTDTVCRQGGDEFVILLSEINNANDADLVGKQLITALAAPHLLGDRELRVTASIGISIYPDHGHDAEGLVHCADLAMYKAKTSGGGCYCTFSKD